MEETLTPQERKALVESIKDAAIERSVLHHYGLSEKEAERFGAFEEASLTTEETDDLVKEFFEAFARAAACTLHIKKLYGENVHHIVECVFKAFARALGEACSVDEKRAGVLPSTKGTL